jgi:hypothetical protein
MRATASARNAGVPPGGFRRTIAVGDAEPADRAAVRVTATTAAARRFGNDNRNSGKPLAIAGNSTADGAKAVQQSGTPTWTISTTQDAYTLRYTTSGKVLDVNAGSSTQRLQLQQWSANGGTNQMWYLRPTGDGYYTIAARNNGLLADVNGAATSDGAQVVQWTANGGTNQQWQFVPA